MRKILWVLFFVLVSNVMGQAGETLLVPPLKIGSSTFKYWGYTQYVYSSTKDSGVSDADFQVVRPRLYWETPGLWGGMAEFELAKRNQSGDNWLRHLVVNYGGWTFGKFFVSPDPTQPYFALETVKYPRYPYGFYAWGARFGTELGKGWSILLDATGPTDLPPFSDDSFDYLVVGSRLTKKLKADGCIIGSVRVIKVELSSQLSERFSRFSFNFKAEDVGHPEFRLRGMAHVATEEDGPNKWGAWLEVLYRLAPAVDSHIRYDYQKDSEGDDSLIATFGAQLYPFKGKLKNLLSITQDIEQTFLGDDNDTLFWLRFQSEF